MVSVAEHNLVRDTSARTHRAAHGDYSPSTEGPTPGTDILRRVRTADICRIARQLATLLHAGMPLVPALSALAEQLQSVSARRIPHAGRRDHALAEVMKQVADCVNAGSTLASALARHPDVFSNLFVNMVAAGEASGTLEEVLIRLAEMLEKRVHLAVKVRSAVAYPLMMIIVATAVVVFLLSFVVPSITQIFLEMNHTLPWPTRLLIGISAFIKTYLLLIAVVAGAALFGITAACRNPKGRWLVDRSKLKMPLFGRLFLKFETARLTRTLGILLVSGIPILGALQIVKKVIQNSFLAASLDSLKESVSKGETLANAMRKTGLFPPIVCHVIATGQISGEVEAGLINIADMYDAEVEMTAKTLTSLLEPAILLVMGVIVGFIVLAILLPIFEISQVF
jgi:general secretion pathway protein F